MPDSDGIDLDYISNIWGGSKLRLQLQGERGRFLRTADVWIAHPPRYQGSTITPESWASRNNHGVDLKQQLQSRESGINPVDLLKTMSQLRAEDLDLLRKMTTTTSRQPIIEQPKNQMQDFINMAKTWKQLQGLFGVSDTPQAAVIPPPLDDSANLISQITGLISAFKGQGQQPQQPRKQRITPPQRSTPQPRPQPQQNHKQDMSSVLAGMETDKLNEILLTAFSSMDQTKREIVIENFLRSTGLMSVDEGDEDGDETEDYEDPDGQPAGNDEDDDPVNRPGD